MRAKGVILYGIALYVLAAFTWYGIGRYHTKTITMDNIEKTKTEDQAKRYGEYIGMRGLIWFGDNWGTPHGTKTYTSDEVYEAVLAWDKYQDNEK
jgi:hypothetical protein